MTQADDTTNAAAKAATEAYNLNRQNEEIAFKQKDDAEKQEEFNTSIEAMQARSKAKVAAGESGTAGLSVDALINDYTASELRYRDSLKQNLAWEKQQANNRVKGYAAQAWSQYNAAKMKRPSFLGAGLRIAGAGFDAADKAGFFEDL